jgi:hypothetical protein
MFAWFWVWVGYGVFGVGALGMEGMTAWVLAGLV